MQQHQQQQAARLRLRHRRRAVSCLLTGNIRSKGLRAAGWSVYKVLASPYHVPINPVVLGATVHHGLGIKCPGLVCGEQGGVI